MLVLALSQNIKSYCLEEFAAGKRLHLREQYATNPGGYRTKTVKIKTAIYQQRIP